jgi:hypothetical protein
MNFRGSGKNHLMICVDTRFYSVPEYLVGKAVIVKKYRDEIRIYAANTDRKIPAARGAVFAELENVGDTANALKTS